MASTGPRRQTEVPPKSTLFCPDCEYQGRADGDWDVRERADQRRIACPVCETTVATRPRAPEGRAIGTRSGL